MKNIFDLLDRSLPNKSQVGAISWENKIKTSKAMLAVQDYFANELGFPQKEYTWIDDVWFTRWSNLRILERTDYIELDRRYCHPSHNFQRDEIVDESFHLLKKA